MRKGAGSDRDVRREKMHSMHLLSLRKRKILKIDPEKNLFFITSECEEKRYKRIVKSILIVNFFVTSHHLCRKIIVMLTSNFVECKGIVKKTLTKAHH